MGLPRIAGPGQWTRFDLFLYHFPMFTRTPRYLVPFDPKRVPHYFTDVLIIGSGLAGLRAAIDIDPRLSALIVTKNQSQESNSAYAQGGIAGVLDPLDDFASHVRLFASNVPALENVANLDRLPAAGFTVIALPMKIRGGSGGPTRIVALLND